MRRKLRIGVVGLGIGRTHIGPFRAHSREASAACHGRAGPENVFSDVHHSGDDESLDGMAE